MILWPKPEGEPALRDVALVLIPVAAVAAVAAEVYGAPFEIACWSFEALTLKQLMMQLEKPLIKVQKY